MNLHSAFYQNAPFMACIGTVRIVDNFKNYNDKTIPKRRDYDRRAGAAN